MVPNAAFSESWLGFSYLISLAPKRDLTCLPEEDQGLDFTTLGTMETFKLQNHSPKVLCFQEPLGGGMRP